jgi:hypothetical protein
MNDVYVSAGIGLILIAFGAHGIITGAVRDKWLMRIRRAENPILFWIQVGIYLVVGFIAIFEAIRLFLRMV